MAKVLVYGQTQIGDELLAIAAEPVRLAAETARLLWSDRPAVKTASPNVVYRVRARVLVARDDALALDAAASALAALMTDSTASLVVKDSPSGATLRTYADARFDRVARELPRGESLGRHAEIVCEFTTATDPVGGS
jgi:hypothetical protein